MSAELARAALRQARDALDRLLADEATLAAVTAAAHLIADSQRAGGTLYSCGNGGSMSDAMHLAEELSGRFRRDRRPYRAMAISDPAYLSCAANDFGYERVFARWVEAFGRPGDVLFAISTSGASPNVLAAARAARPLGLKVIALTGRSDGPLGALADLSLVTPAGRWADRVQELHIKVIHVLIELIERELDPGNWRDE